MWTVSNLHATYFKSMKGRELGIFLHISNINKGRRRIEWQRLYFHLFYLSSTKYLFPLSCNVSSSRLHLFHPAATGTDTLLLRLRCHLPQVLTQTNPLFDLHHAAQWKIPIHIASKQHVFYPLSLASRILKQLVPLLDQTVTIYLRLHRSWPQFPRHRDEERARGRPPISQQISLQDLIQVWHVWYLLKSHLEHWIVFHHFSLFLEIFKNESLTDRPTDHPSIRPSINQTMKYIHNAL